MKREKSLTCLTGWVLGFLTAFGAVGCMVTGLQLNVTELGNLALVCAGAAGISAVCLYFKRGGTVLLGGLALLSWYVWRQTDGAEKLLGMLYRISVYYDSAYGWGTLPWEGYYYRNGVMDLPLAVIGGTVAVITAWTVCRRKRSALALAVASIPVAACFVVTDTVPGEWYLYLWMLGVLILVLTGGTRRRGAAQGVSLTALASPVAAIALAALFFAFPQEEYHYQPQQLQERVMGWFQQLPELLEDVAEEAAQGQQTTTKINLSTVGPKYKYTYAVMDVRASASGTLYLREQDYDTYDGTGWTAGRQRVEDFGVGVESTNVGEVTIRTRRIRDNLYLPYYPDGDKSVTGGRAENSEGWKEYTIGTRMLPENWRELLGSVETLEDSTIEFPIAAVEMERYLFSSSVGVERYLILPNETREWASELVSELLSDELTATAKAETIAAYVRGSASYDLQTARMPAGETDFVRWFLEDSETGYCVHFATATVVLLRAAGIQARYVEGYLTAGEAGRFVTVTQDQAHAWAEYYEPLLDTWIVLESTPADLGAGETAAETESSEETLSTTEAPTTAPAESKAPEKVPSEETPPDTEQEKVLPGWLLKLLGWLLSIALLVAAVILQRRVRLALRLRRQSRGKTNARAMRKWQEILLLSRRLGEEPAQELEALAQKAKFSQHNLSAEEMARLDGAIQSARQRLKQKNWLQRFIDQYVFAAY